MNAFKKEYTSEIVFCDHCGNPACYTQDGTHVFTFSGEQVAYLHGDSGYSFSGEHLGWFEKGWIRDNPGYCVFYTKDAQGWPVKPVKSVKSIRPVKAVKSLSWSDLSGEHIFKQ